MCILLLKFFKYVLFVLQTAELNDPARVSQSGYGIFISFFNVLWKCSENGLLVFFLTFVFEILLRGPKVKGWLERAPRPRQSLNSSPSSLRCETIRNHSAKLTDNTRGLHAWFEKTNVVHSFHVSHLLCPISECWKKLVTQRRLLFRATHYKQRQQSVLLYLIGLTFYSCSPCDVYAF